jgi:hypothetical protein
VSDVRKRDEAVHTAKMVEEELIPARFVRKKASLAVLDRSRGLRTPGNMIALSLDPMQLSNRLFQL